LEVAAQKQAEVRSRFSLPAQPPANGVSCNFCGNGCKIPPREVGFCGLSENDGGKLKRPDGLVAELYYDPHPTNCVSAKYCGASGVGYPKYSYVNVRERGYYNLSVFCIGCSASCLFCQNWHYLSMIREKEVYTVPEDEFLSYITEKVSCICFFGGDPTVQLEKITDYSIKAKKKSEDRILRFCLETNGNFNTKLLKRFAKVSLESGGGIKFDLKTYNPNLNIALSGIGNEKAYESFELLGSMHKEREKVPFLRASTLLIPGYITPIEVEEIAKFISSIDCTIPYSLLAFSPQFMMSDLPTTPRKLAYESKRKAEKHLVNVNIGNEWLLR
jgi:pyruvate formate lyase activating enzyme